MNIIIRPANVYQHPLKIQTTVMQRTHRDAVCPEDELHCDSANYDAGIQFMIIWSLSNSVARMCNYIALIVHNFMGNEHNN